MTDSEQNPYQMWLHLPMDAPNHYELLGLSLGESNATAISEAASRVRRSVCAIRPSADQTNAWSDLLSEIETAESVLTDDEQRKQYNESIGLDTNADSEEEIPMALPVSTPPPPAPTPASHPTTHPLPPSGYPGYAAPVYPTPVAPIGTPVPAASVPLSSVPDPMAPVGQTTAATTDSARPPTVPAEPAPQFGAKAATASRKLRQRKQSDRNLPIYLGVAAVGMMILAGVVVVLNQGDKKPVPPATPIAKSPKATANAPSQTAPQSTTGPTEVAVASPKSRTEQTQPSPQPASEPSPAPMPEPEPAPMPEPASEPTPSPEPSPAPMPEPEPAPPEATPEQIATLNQTMQKIRNELSKADFASSDALLTSARAMLGSANQKAQLDRLDAASDLLKQFHEGVDRSLSELKAVDVLEVGPTQVAIVEIRPDELIIKVDGRNRTYPRRDLPALLGLTLADRVMPASEPVNQLAKAMYLAVHPQRTASVLAKAKELLQQGIGSGADTENLVAFIEDSYGSAAPVTPLPDMPAPMPEPTRPPTDAEVAQMTEVLGKVHEDLGKGNLAGATKRLESLADAPGTTAQRDSLARLIKSTAYLEEFHAAMQQAIDELKPDDEVPLTASVTVKVLQVTKDKLRIELTGGTQRTIDRGEMPAALAVELAQRKLGDDSKSKVLSALYVIFNPKSTSKFREQAKGWIEEAGQDGDLLPLFEILQPQE